MYKTRRHIYIYTLNLYEYYYYIYTLYTHTIFCNNLLIPTLYSSINLKCDTQHKLLTFYLYLNDFNMQYQKSTHLKIKIKQKDY